WAAHGAVGRCFDVPALWREAVADAARLHTLAMPCGHYIAEEQPQALLADALSAFVPPEVGRRRKSGFGMPLRSQLRNELRAPHGRVARRAIAA
ncbi:MAG: asparagine synthase-related protein, partial [Acidimicrobiales bacterium]